MTKEFPNTVSYNHFVELMQSVIMPMTIFAKTCCLGKCTGISFVDSTPIQEGKPIYIKDLLDKRGNTYQGYVIYNKETKQADFSCKSSAKSGHLRTKN